MHHLTDLDDIPPDPQTPYVTCDHCGCMHHVDDGCRTATCPAVIDARFEQVAGMVRASANGELMRSLGDHTRRMLEQMTEVDSAQLDFRVFVRDLDDGVLVARVDTFFGNARLTIESGAPAPVENEAVAACCGESAQQVIKQLAEAGVRLERDARGVVVAMAKPTMWLAESEDDEAPASRLVPDLTPEQEAFGAVRALEALPRDATWLAAHEDEVSGAWDDAMLAMEMVEHPDALEALHAKLARIRDALPAEVTPELLGALVSGSLAELGQDEQCYSGPCPEVVDPRPRAADTIYRFDDGSCLYFDGMGSSSVHHNLDAARHERRRWEAGSWGLGAQGVA